MNNHFVWAAQVPEPTSLTLLVAGSLGLLFVSRIERRTRGMARANRR
jgi:hypothetical protein